MRYIREELLEDDYTVKESPAGYQVGKPEKLITYINPFEDKFFKKIFASETSKEVLRSFINGVLEGRRYAQDITYGKNEYPGEIESEGNVAFDVVCTDVDGTVFMVEMQREKQRYFKERSLFYASRLISDQAPKGDKAWKYNLSEVYVICLIEKINLPDSGADVYCRRVGLCDKQTREVFYDKLEFIYLELGRFKKKEEDLHTALDEWMFALKHAPDLKEVPLFFKTPEIGHFFQLARFSNLTRKERTMYRTKQQVRWDNQNAFDFAREEGMEQGALAEKKVIARNFKIEGVNPMIIAKATGLSIEEIAEL